MREYCASFGEEEPREDSEGKRVGVEERGWWMGLKEARRSSSLSSQVVGRSGFSGSGSARSIDVKPIDQAQKGLTDVRGCRGQQRRIEA